MKKFDSRAYVVVIAGVVLSLVLGVLYSWSVLSKAISDQWGWSALQSSFPYMLAMGVFACGVALAGPIQDRIGPRLVGTVGALMCGGGMIVASFGSADNSMPIILGFGLLTGLGVGTAYSASTPAAIKWFGQERKGLITGIVVCGFGLSSAYLAPLTTWLLTIFDINGVFRLLGIVFMIVGAISALFISNPPAGYCAPAIEKKEGESLTCAPTVRDYSTKEMLKTPKFYVIWFAYLCAAFAGLMIIGQLTKIASFQVKGTELGFLLVIALSLGNAGGRLLAGIFVDKAGTAKTMMVVFVGQALCMLAIGFIDSFIPLVIVGILVGAFYGSNLTIFPTVVAGNYGTKNFGANYGLVFLAFGFGGVFGSFTAGQIFDATGSYQIAFYIAAALCAIAAVLAPTAGKVLSTKK